LTLAAKWNLGVLQELGFVFWGECLGFGSEFCVGFFVEFGQTCGTGGDRDAHLHEEFFLACGSANAEESRRFFPSIAELVRGVGGAVNGLARGYDGLCSAKDGLDLAFENNERFFKVVAVRRRSASRRNVHVDQAKAVSGVLAG